MVDFVQLLDHLSMGILVLNESLDVLFWNRWMAEHSLIARQDAVGKPIYDLFPELSSKGFIAKAHNVFKVGHPAFFTQKIHQNLFPLPTARSFLNSTPLIEMQQTVIISPLKDADGITMHILVSVFDISDWVIFQQQLLKSKDELEKLTLIDDLTQISNRRSIMERLRIEHARHLRKKQPMALVMIDIDHFKQVNDTHGHLCGDYVLCEMARVFSDELRVYDVMGRYGGEEFLMLLPETDREQAILVSERVRAAVERKLFFYDKKDIKLTISLGVAWLQASDNIPADELLRKADDRLYRAKKIGRNRVVAFDV